MNKPLYLDYNATTPVDPRVFEAMAPWYSAQPGNSGSRTHAYGQAAKEAVDQAREMIADALNGAAEDVIFTSGATESNNLAITGLAEHGIATNRKHILTTAIEHKAVLEPLEYLRQKGFEIELLPVTPGGWIETQTVQEHLREDTLLVSVMHANNETGILQPVTEIADLLANKPIFFHTDAAQTFGKEVDTIKSLNADLISISGHKIHGPQGIGVLYVKRKSADRRAIMPLLRGGGQERGLRPGTLPVPLVIGLGCATEIAMKEHQSRHQAAKKVRETFLQQLTDIDYRIHGDLDKSQPHVVNIQFPGVDSEALMMALREEIAISNGSACTASSYEPSHVLRSMGVEDDDIEESVRISWGPGIEEIPAHEVCKAVQSLCISL